VRVAAVGGEEARAALLAALADGGVDVRVVDAPYVRAKLFVVDGAAAFVGSQNPTATSLDQNRELGIVVAEPAILRRLRATFEADFAHGQELP
jgi:phosphatidylserine/phosphatidylglycerophosphate/cardiolipin synthase-like enzyme